MRVSGSAMSVAVIFGVSSRNGGRNIARAFSPSITRSSGALGLPRTVSGSSLKASSTFLGDFQTTLQNAFSSMANKSPYYTIAITGSSGLVGTALIDELSGEGKTVNGKEPRVIRLVRGDGDATDNTLSWNPSEDTALDPSDLRDVDAVIHLAGENVATNIGLPGPLNAIGIRPWSSQKKDEIMNSRVGPTKALATAIKNCDTSTTFVTASGVGVYGCDFIGESAPKADETSDTLSTTGFLADVSRAWEAASSVPGERVVNLRFGVVMSQLGGTLAKLYPIFFLGGGGNVGSGEQYFSFVSARDVARSIVHTLETPTLKGPVNVCAPEPCTNAAFTSALGRVMGRPTILPLPEFVVKLLFGDMGDELLLGGTRVVPKKLLSSGFCFNHPDIDSALESAINQEKNI